MPGRSLQSTTPVNGRGESSKSRSNWLREWDKTNSSIGKNRIARGDGPNTSGKKRKTKRQPDNAVLTKSSSRTKRRRQPNGGAPHPCNRFIGNLLKDVLDSIQYKLMYSFDRESHRQKRSERSVSSQMNRLLKENQQTGLNSLQK